MNDIDFGWIIGIIEGEGSFSNDRRCIVVGSTDEFVVKRLQELCGGNVYGPTYYGSKRKDHWKPFYQWRLGGWENVSLIADCIKPFLSPRRQEQAQALLDNPPLALVNPDYRKLSQSDPCPEGHVNHFKNIGNGRICITCANLWGSNKISCEVCGKEIQQRNMNKHIERKHIRA